MPGRRRRFSSRVIRQRRRERTLLASIEVPAVLFSDDLEALGRPPAIVAADMLEGVGVSAGSFTGPALVLSEPVATAERDFVLVCPSTDPGLDPALLAREALIMETGGVLSHGAIVAREFGLPAVVGISCARQRIRTGEQVRVDGNAGTVHLLNE